MHSHLVILFLAWAGCGLSMQSQIPEGSVACQTFVQLLNKAIDKKGTAPPKWSCLAEPPLSLHRGPAFPVRDDAGTVASLKIVPIKDARQIDLVDAEHLFTKSLRSEHIIKPMRTKTVGDRGLVLANYLGAKNLRQWLQSAPQKDLQDQLAKLRVFKGLVETVASLHQDGLIHANLRLEDIGMTAASVPIIADASHIRDPKIRHTCFNSDNLEAMALERLREGDCVLDASVDVYSLGVILYQMFHDGNLPFTADDPKVLAQYLEFDGTYTFRAGIHRGVVKIITQCMTAFPNTRLDIDELLSSLDHVLEAKRLKPMARFEWSTNCFLNPQEIEELKRGDMPAEEDLDPADLSEQVQKGEVATKIKCHLPASQEFFVKNKMSSQKRILFQETSHGSVGSPVWRGLAVPAVFFCLGLILALLSKSAGSTPGKKSGVDSTRKRCPSVLSPETEVICVAGSSTQQPPN